MKRIAFWTVLVVLNLFLAGLAVELYARIKHGTKLAASACDLEFRQPDFVLNHSLRPNGSGYSISKEWHVPYRINGFGLRDREMSLRKPAGTIRILVLGDSFTEGHGVSIEDTFVKVLETRLNAATAGSPRYELVNCGVGTYSPLLEYLLLTMKGLALEPDLVVLLYDLGDLHDDYEYTHTTTFAEDGTPLRCAPYKRVRTYSRHPIEQFLLRHSHGYLYLETRINKTLFSWRYGTTQDPSVLVDSFVAYRDSPDLIDRLWDNSRRYLDLIAATLARRNVPFILVTYPYGLEVRPDEWSEGRIIQGFEPGKVYDRPPVIGSLEVFAAERGIPLIDLRPDLRASPLRPLYYAFDGHWNAQGHSVVAEALLRHFVGDGLLARVGLWPAPGGPIVSAAEASTWSPHL